MTDPALITVFENGLPPQAKFLYSILSAYTGAGDVAVVPESHVARIMQLSPARLRDYRSILNKSGYCSVALRGENIIFQIVGSQPPRENPDVARVSDRPAPPSTPPNMDSDPSTARENHDVARENHDVARENHDVARAGGDNRGGVSERDLIIPLPEKNSLTHSLPDAEQKMSVAILTDPAIGMSRLNSHRLAIAYPFADIRAFCTQFVADGREAREEAGLIAYRLEAAETVPPTLHNDLYQRHRTPAEIADEAAQRLADEQAAESLRAQWAAEDAAKAARVPTQPAANTGVALCPPPDSPPADAAEIWTAVLSDLAATLPTPTYETWVRDTDVLGYEDGEFVIGVPHAHARDWLTNRLRPQIKRTLSRITQRSTDVSFAVRPRPNPNGDAHP